MIVLRNNSSRLKEKDFTRERRYIRHYLPDVSDSLGEGEVYARGIVEGIKNNIVAPIKKLGIGIKMRNKTKNEIDRAKTAFDIKRLRRKEQKYGKLKSWQLEGLRKKIRDINLGTSKKGDNLLPFEKLDDLGVSLNRSRIREIADTHGLDHIMKEAVKRSKLRAQRQPQEILLPALQY